MGRGGWDEPAGSSKTNAEGLTGPGMGHRVAQRGLGLGWAELVRLVEGSEGGQR